MHLHIVRFNLTVTQGPQLQVWVVPLSPRDLSTPGLTAAEICWHSEFVRVWQAVTPPSPIGSFTSNIHTTTLHLNAFRGVRAISKFDQPFTPTHKSSENFSTFTSSVLHPGTTGTSTCSWVDHLVSRLYPLPIALFRLAFAAPPVHKTLNLVVSNNSQAHYAKGTWSLVRRLAPTACRRTVSGSIALRFLRFFSPFLHSTGSLSVSREYLALPDGTGRFRQDFSGPALLRILNVHKSFTCTGLSPCIVHLSMNIPLKSIHDNQSYNPNM